jgi:extracellular elastinolytic metalloproteinase
MSFLEDINILPSYSIRDDSYTDTNTGVTHVYVRQFVNGLEVVDGDINLNIKDGVVISYGNSFYDGPVPDAFTTSDWVWDPHHEFCLDLGNMIANAIPETPPQSDQVVMGSLTRPQPESTDISSLERIHEWNCAQVESPYITLDEIVSSEPDSRTAILQFMIQATPDEDLQQDILERFQEYFDDMTSTMESTLVGNNVVHVEMIDNVPDTVNPVKAKLGYVQVPAGESTVLKLVWRFEVEMQDNWYEAAVSAHPPHTIFSVVDWASDSPIPNEPSPNTPATYNVFAWGVNDPSEGSRSIYKEGSDLLASPLGWHTIPVANDPFTDSRARRHSPGLYVNTTTTRGNNVFAHENWQGQSEWLENYRPDGGADLVFDFKYNPKLTNNSDSLDEAKKYINATVTQLFYTSNMVHDLLYRYGFDEPSGNFQQHNFGRGGSENDAIIANAQDGSGYNNANFMTPPDGQNGRCRMYLWNTASPYRDGDLEAGIVIHELSHGLSTRLTGGPANSGCLGWGESGGMGEGWGDFLATTIRSTKNYSDYAMGAWAANRPTGIRNFVYSLNEEVNPSTYKTLDKPGYWGVHAIGEVWAEILWVVSNRLIAKHGYSDSLFPPEPLPDGTIPEGDFYRPAEYTAFGEKRPLVPKHGNSLAFQLVLNGMKLQVCRPSFFDARDAIIQADAVLTGGENFCELWQGFAERGLGADARVEGRTPWGGGVRTNGYAVPVNCQGAEPEV